MHISYLLGAQNCSTLSPLISLYAYLLLWAHTNTNNNNKHREQQQQQSVSISSSGFFWGLHMAWQRESMCVGERQNYNNDNDDASRLRVFRERSEVCIRFVFVLPSKGILNVAGICCCCSLLVLLLLVVFVVSLLLWLSALFLKAASVASAPLPWKCNCNLQTATSTANYLRLGWNSRQSLLLLTSPRRRLSEFAFATQRLCLCLCFCFWSLPHGSTHSFPQCLCHRRYRCRHRHRRRRRSLCVKFVLSFSVSKCAKRFQSNSDTRAEKTFFGARSVANKR